MIEFKYKDGRRGILCESASELPEIKGRGIKRHFTDFETTSFDPKVPALRPYNGHRIAGIATLFDDEEVGFYVPIRHSDEDWNLPPEIGLRWLTDILQEVPTWINHNLVFDANFAFCDAGVVYEGRMIDTMIGPRLIDSDRMKYDLKSLTKDWLNYKWEERDVIKEALKALKSKNYGDCPADIMGRYAITDVFAARDLYRYIEKNLPLQCRDIYEQEILLTPVLFDMTRRGVMVNKVGLKQELMGTLRRLIELQEYLSEVYGDEYIDHHTHLYEIVHNRLGLPILARDPKSKNAVFDKHVLRRYKVHPEVLVDEFKMKVIDAIMEERDLSHYQTTFLEPYLNLSDDNFILHTEFNQNVRTGRMSSRGPNLQGVSPRARQWVVPRPNHSFAGYDGSQIEFRAIVHYTGDQRAIEAYKTDPKTDFHSWIADQLGVGRKAGKTINFGLSYGAASSTIMRGLATDPDIMEEVGSVVNKMVEDGEILPEDRQRVYQHLCSQKAELIFMSYHERFPGTRRLSNYAKQQALQRGYVYNGFGRRRHLHPKFARKAFNSIIQSFASDLVKQKMILLAPRYNRFMRDMNIHIVLQVHDEILFEVPKELVQEDIAHYLQTNLDLPAKLQPKANGDDNELKVPFVWDGNWSDVSWKEAK